MPEVVDKCGCRIGDCVSCHPTHHYCPTFQRSIGFFSAGQAEGGHITLHFFQGECKASGGVQQMAPVPQKMDEAADDDEEDEEEEDEEDDE